MYFFWFFSPPPFCPFLAMERYPLFFACHFLRSLPQSSYPFHHFHLEFPLDSIYSLFHSFSYHPRFPSSPNLVLSNLINSNGTWNIPLISGLFDSLSVREIQKIVISSSPTIEFLWTPSPSGIFSASSTYRFISSQRVSSYSSPFDPAKWKLLWKLKLNAQYNSFSGKQPEISFLLRQDSKLSFISPLMIHCVLCATRKKILFFIYFLDVASQGLLGDHPFGLLILKPRVLFLCLAGFKASSLHMLSLAFHKMMFIFFKSLPLFFVMGYDFTGTKPFMMESFQIFLSLLFPSKKQHWLMLQPGIQFLLKKHQLGLHLWKDITRSILIQQSEITSQLKLQSVEITQAPF